MTTSPLGPFIGPTHVRQAVKATLDRWAPFYVAEAIRQVGADPAEMPGFTDFVNQPLTSVVTHEEAPRYVVVVPGTLAPPERRGNGTYRAVWDVRIELWMWGADYQQTEDKLSNYLTALRQLLLQQASLGGFAESTTWRAERYAQVQGGDTTYRTWGQAVLQVAVSVDGVVDAFAGPAVPPDDPTAPPRAAPAVTSTHVTVTPRPT